jgi:hypothetical protein
MQPMATLDPIVSLAVGMAEAPGSFAFLLGSGVSRDAGIPTGSDVLRIAQGDLYRVSTGETETPADEDLDAWLGEHGHSGLGYSEILELLAPDAEGRRAYLAKHFEGKEPGEAHRLLAALAANGLIRVFVTTNFDRLLESALAERGITPIVVTSDDDLRRTTQREQAASYVLKPHGDYLQQTIRNTPDELAKLDPGLEVEVQEVFDRFGVVVLGYSGSDEALGALLRGRDSRYGTYWVSRSEPADAAGAIVEACGARVILRDTAADFLADLSSRIEAFRAHPSGETPALVASEVVQLLRANDDVGLRERLNKEWRALEARIQTALEPRLALETADETLAFEREVLPGLERMLAALSPLIEHRSPLFAEQAARMIRLIERRHELAPRAWPLLWQWAGWWLAQVCGALAVHLENFAAAAALFSSRLEDNKDASVASMGPTKMGIALAERVLAESSSEKWSAPEWEHLNETLGGSRLLRERYPELIDRPGGVTTSLNDFNLLTCFDAVRRGEPWVIGYFGMYHEGGRRLAQRLVRDAEFRGSVAAMFGVEPHELPAEMRSTIQSTLSDPGKRVYLPGKAWGWNSAALGDLPPPETPS